MCLIFQPLVALVTFSSLHSHFQRGETAQHLKKEGETTKTSVTLCHGEAISYSPTVCPL